MSKYGRLGSRLAFANTDEGPENRRAVRVKRRMMTGEQLIAEKLGGGCFIDSGHQLEQNVYGLKL